MKRAAVQEASLPAQSIEAITRRIAKATAHPLRVRILAALNEAEMGPRGFCRRNSDVDLREASRQFRSLRDLGCIELVGRKPGRGRERLYKATRRAMFDLSSWQAIPPEKKGPVSAEVVSTYMSRVAQAADGGTLDNRDERWISWTALQFDERGWSEFIAAVESAFARALQMGVDAPLRMVHTGGPSIPVTVGIFCFESPPRGLSSEAEHQPTAPPVSFDDSFIGLRSSKALATPMRIRILVELNKRPMSPRAFHSRFGGGTLEHVAVEFRRLEHLRCIELISEKKGQGKGGVAERVYRAIRRSLFDVEAWKSLPVSLRTEVTSITLTTFVERIAEAASAGVLDGRDDRHLSWTGMHYDELAWQAMLLQLDGLFHLSLRIHREAASRVAVSGGAVIPVTVALSCFESPQESAVVEEATLRGFLEEPDELPPLQSSFTNRLRH